MNKYNFWASFLQNKSKLGAVHYIFIKYFNFLFGCVNGELTEDLDLMID